MRRLAVALAAIILLRADMYPDASNAKLPQARENLGLGPAVSITDYGADSTGVASSGAAFNSCVTSGKDCHIPAGIYLLGCAGYVATGGITVRGEGTSSVLKMPPGCTLPTNLLTGADVKDLAIDMNGGSAGAFSVLSPANPSNTTPVIERIRISGGVPSGFLISFSDATNPVIRGNYLAFDSAASTPNRCLLLNATGGPVIGGEIGDNRCVNTGMWIDASGVRIVNNDISGWAYSAGIGFEASATNKKHIITGNYLHDSATTLDVDSTPGVGMEIWASDVLVSNNTCLNLGGSCLDIGGQRNVLIGNRAQGINKHGYPYLGAFSSRYANATYNASGSHFIGNWAGDDGSVVPMYGYAEQAGAYQNIIVSNNDFIGATLGGVYPVYSAGTRIDAQSKGGNPSGDGLVAAKSTEAAPVPSFEFTGLDAASYKTFKLSCYDMQVGVGATDIAIQTGTGATPTWITANYASTIMGTSASSATPVVRNANPVGEIPINATSLLPGSALFANFEVSIGNVGRSGVYQMLTSVAAYPIAGNAVAQATGSAHLGSTSPVTAVRVIGVGGNIDYGTCRLYGLI